MKDQMSFPVVPNNFHNDKVQIHDQVYWSLHGRIEYNKY